MAWELQSHMHSYVAPSIWAAAQADGDPNEWLALVYANQNWR